MGFSTVLCVVVLVFTVLAWWPNPLGQRVSWGSRLPGLLLTLSSLVQIMFIILVEKNVLTLDYSLKFAILVLPLCVLSLVVALRRKRTATDLPYGALPSTIAGLVMWMFLISFHRRILTASLLQRLNQIGSNQTSCSLPLFAVISPQPEIVRSSRSRTSRPQGSHQRQPCVPTTTGSAPATLSG
jgi:hypothetical protein